jgi:hypothetical protein
VGSFAFVEAVKNWFNRNANVLSFADDPDAEAPLAVTETKGIKSAHDLLADATLSKELEDDRGLSAQLPESFLSMPPAIKMPAKEPKPAKKPKEAFEYVKPEASTSNAEQQALQEQIASVSASLKAMKKKRRASSSEEEDDAAAKKQKKAAAIDGAALLTAQREAYLASGKAVRKGDIVDDQSTKVLSSFKTEIRQARKQIEEEKKLKPKTDVPVDGYQGEILEEEEYSDDK